MSGGLRPQKAHFRNERFPSLPLIVQNTGKPPFLTLAHVKKLPEFSRQQSPLVRQGIRFIQLELLCVEKKVLQKKRSHFRLV